MKREAYKNSDQFEVCSEQPKTEIFGERRTFCRQSSVNGSSTLLHAAHGKRHTFIKWGSSLLILAFGLLLVVGMVGCENRTPSPTPDSAQPQETGTVNEEPALWTSDLTAARQKAQETGKPIFLLFTGSDWCHWCVKLEKEVLATPEFESWAKENLILVKLDFLRYTEQAQDIKDKNEALRQQYGISGFPTVVLLAPDGQIVDQTGYQSGGPAAYIEHLKSLLKTK